MNERKNERMNESAKQIIGDMETWRHGWMDECMKV
jgi:hypothetical protein